MPKLQEQNLNSISTRRAFSWNYFRSFVFEIPGSDEAEPNRVAMGFHIKDRVTDEGMRVGSRGELAGPVGGLEIGGPW